MIPDIIQFTRGQTLIFFGNQTRNVVKGCDLEMISMTFSDHNLVNWKDTGWVQTMQHLSKKAFLVPVQPHN